MSNPIDATRITVDAGGKNVEVDAAWAIRRTDSEETPVLGAQEAGLYVALTRRRPNRKSDEVIAISIPIDVLEATIARIDREGWR